MKILLLSLLTLCTAHAEEITIHPTSIYMIMFFLIMMLIITYAYFVNKCEKSQKMIKDKDEKIKVLEAAKIVDEKESLIKQQDVEKEITTLKHTISDLERHIKEGTKNQVVAKLEALQKKRHNPIKS